MKICNVCCKSLSMSSFSKDSSRSDGIRSRCRQCDGAMTRRWVANNRGKEASRKKKWQEQNADIHAEQSRKWRSLNLEQSRDQAKQWRASNQEQAAIQWRQKRAKRRGALGSHTKQDLEALLASQDNRCIYCAACFVGNQRHLDHIIPLSRGGTHFIWNVQFLCATCNLRKHNKLPHEFLNEPRHLAPAA